MEKNRSLEIYIHIPFCVKKCAYCDFLSFQAGKKEMAAYVDALAAEIEAEREGGRVTSIFFGGGTPSILPGEEIKRIMDVIRKKYSLSGDAEITIEVNPGTVNREKLKDYKSAGINRLSIGLQSIHNEELKALGRIHTWEAFQESYGLARAAGFQNINIDLMSALPGQKPEAWRKTLKTVTELGPEHISAYSLIIEQGTAFFDRFEEDVKRREDGLDCLYLPSEEEERQMYYDTEKILEQAGYHRYEISNYAKPGYECRHNSGYWKRENYRGFGLGASSLMDEERYRNTDLLEQYLKHDFAKEDNETLDTKAQMEEFMFLGLRLNRGISVGEFEKKFPVPFEEAYGDVSKRLIEEGMLKRTGEYISLTEKGIDVSNYVLAKFLL